MRWGTYFILSVFSSSSLVSVLHLPNNKEIALDQTEQKIQELEDIKRGYESKAIYHENQADRLQFDDNTYLEMRRHNQLAEEYRAKAAAVQKEIDRLKDKSNNKYYK